MGRKRKTAEKESKKHHLLARLRVRDDLGAREDDLCRGCIHESGHGPANGLLLHRFLCHLVAMGDALNGHATMTRLELKREHERKEEEVVAAEEQRYGKQFK
jgi:hypothetical protein